MGQARDSNGTDSNGGLKWDGLKWDRQIIQLIFIVFILFILPNLTYADRLTTPWFKISQIDGYSNTSGGVITANTSINTTCNCSAGNPGAGFRFQAGQAATSEDGVKMGMSLLLSAYMAGKEVQLDYEDSSAYCYIYLVRVRDPQ